MSSSSLVLYCLNSGSVRLLAIASMFIRGKSRYNLVEVQTVFPKAAAVGNFTVFNIKGNSYRLITSIDYQKRLIYIKYVLTHAEYDKEQWKNDPYF
ncbi:MAG: type II toxin-antitoxin system HigB family toxin [Microcystis aeruginosa G11-06]|nr:type II toxin-antitoxin system HigB family toxin [Microcystis aeruginosa G11-06]NCS50506.1 type II toxin-antitoxin system HigB family toxin [Microcystis aeruginosa BK11-02]